MRNPGHLQPGGLAPRGGGGRGSLSSTRGTSTRWPRRSAACWPIRPERDRLAARALRRSARFSWSSSARSLLDCFEELDPRGAAGATGDESAEKSRSLGANLMTEMPYYLGRLNDGTSRLGQDVADCRGFPKTQNATSSVIFGVRVPVLTCYSYFR